MQKEKTPQTLPLEMPHRIGRHGDSMRTCYPPTVHAATPLLGSHWQGGEQERGRTGGGGGAPRPQGALGLREGLVAGMG